MVNILLLGVIQQLRGQEGGEGGSAKSPRLSTQGGGGSLNIQVDKKIEKRYRKIMANYHEKSYFIVF